MKSNSKSIGKSIGKSNGKGKSNWILISIVLISTVIIIGLLITNKDAIEEGFFGGSKKKYSVEYYYMDGCGHCDDFNKVWEKLIKMEWKNVCLLYTSPSPRD